MSNVEGLKALSDKLASMERATAIKSLRSAAMSSTLPTTKEMIAAAPRGRNAHRTYKGRLVAPGFLSRSIKRISRVNKKTGTASVSIGVKREAFYGIAFLDRGTSKIRGSSWFTSRFKQNSGSIVELFKTKLADRIRKAK